MFTFVIQIWNAGSVLGSVIRIPLTSMATLLAGGVVGRLEAGLVSATCIARAITFRDTNSSEHLTRIDTSGCVD